MAAVQNKGHNFPATSREANVDIYLIMPSCLEVSSGVCVCVCVGGGGGWVGGHLLQIAQKLPVGPEFFSNSPLHKL